MPEANHNLIIEFLLIQLQKSISKDSFSFSSHFQFCFFSEVFAEVDQKFWFFWLFLSSAAHNETFSWLTFSEHLVKFN